MNPVPTAKLSHVYSDYSVPQNVRAVPKRFGLYRALTVE